MPHEGINRGIEELYRYACKGFNLLGGLFFVLLRLLKIFYQYNNGKSKSLIHLSRNNTLLTRDRNV